MTEFVVNLRGHNRTGTQSEILLTDKAVFNKWVAKEITSGHKLTMGVFADDPEQLIGKTAMGMAGNKCFECGSYMRLRYESVTSDRIVLRSSDACEFPEGLPPYDLVIGVPSGKIVFANDLRELVTVEDRHDVNERLGQQRSSEAFARAGLVYVYVGNSSPSVQRDGDDLKVGCFYNYEYENLSEEEYAAADAAHTAACLGSICTDLWAYNAMDYDYFHARMKRVGIDPEEFRDHFVVEVPPGVYAFSDEFADTHEAGVYSRIRRIEGAEYPSIDSGDVEATERFADSHAAKTVTEVRKHRATGLNRLEDILCTLGGGYDWTDGFLRSGSRREDPPFATPFKDYQKASDYDLDVIAVFPVFPVTHIYPIDDSGYAKIQRIPANVDVWWLTLAAMFAKSAICNPSAFDGSPRAGEDPMARAARSFRSHEAMMQTLILIGDLIHSRGIDIRPLCAEVLEFFAAQEAARAAV